MIQRFSLPFIISFLSLALAGCGSDESEPASELRTGVFLDAGPVEGLGFETLTMSGKTNAAGEYSFNAGENVNFSIGGFELPAVQAAAIVSPQDIFAASEVGDPRVTDLSILLQSLDDDNDTSNGILLPLTIESITSDTAIEFGTVNFTAQAESVVAQVNGTQSNLVDANTANADLTENLIDNEVISDECTSDHPFVGRTAELSTLQHGVSGTITVLNDCVIEVTNFNYDGGGPEVFFYAGINQNYVTDTFPIGPRLNRTRWVNDELLLTIPEGKSLDDFNSLSVWCADFSINFGDAVFGDG